jgi:hypothetical protein
MKVTPPLSLFPRVSNYASLSLAHNVKRMAPVALFYAVAVGESGPVSMLIRSEHSSSPAKGADVFEGDEYCRAYELRAVFYALHGMQEGLIHLEADDLLFPPS